MRWSAIAASEPALGAVVFDLLHTIVTGPEPAAEVKVRGTAPAEGDRNVQERYAAAVSAGIGWRPVMGEFTLFVGDVEDVTYIGCDADTGGQHVVRWPASLEYVRPSATPTSLGPPRPVRRLLG